MTFLVTGCPTGYHSVNAFGGYEDLQYTPDRFRITFSGNGHTSSQRALDLAMLHAADVTLAHGCNYFIIVRNAESISTTSFETPGYATTTGSAFGTAQGQYIGNQYSGTASVYGRSTTVYQPGNTFYIQKPHESLIIQICTNSVENAYDAAFLRKQLIAHYLVYTNSTIHN